MDMRPIRTGSGMDKAIPNEQSTPTEHNVGTDHIGLGRSQAQKPEKEAEPVVLGKKKGRKKGSKVKSQALKPRQLNTLLEYKAKGLPIEQAARAAKCPPSTAYRALERYAGWLQELEHIKDYEETRAQLLSAGELRLIKSMLKESTLAKAEEKGAVNALAYGLKQLHDMRRLELGLSTSNVATQSKVTVTAPESSD